MIATSLFSLKSSLVLNSVCFLPQNGTSQQTRVVLSYVIYVSRPGDESFTAAECSGLVLECAPLEHWGIKHEPAPHLISGPRRDFVLLQRWFCSGFSVHAASALLISSRVVVLATWTSNHFFLCASALPRAGADGVDGGQKHAGKVSVGSAEPDKHLGSHLIWSMRAKQVGEGRIGLFRMEIL